MSQSQDLATIYTKAQDIVDVLNANPWPNCGRIVKGKYDYCRQRMVLITLGWMGRDEYEIKGKTPSAKKKVIERLQTALVEDGANIAVDNDWAGATSGALARTLERALRQSVVVDMPDKADIPVEQQRSSQNSEGSPPPPPPGQGFPIANTAKTFFAGIPWILPVGLLVAAGAGWFFYRRGKATGLSGCACGGMAGHAGHDHKEHEDDEGEEGVDSQIVESLRHIPEFRAPGAPRRRPTKVT